MTQWYWTLLYILSFAVAMFGTPSFIAGFAVGVVAALIVGLFEKLRTYQELLKRYGRS